MVRVFLGCLSFLVAVSNLSASHSESRLKVFGKFDYGFLSVLHHHSQWGDGNSGFDYTKSGGQDLLFPTWRAEVGAIISKNHQFSFLYQPIFLETETVLGDDLKIDNITFSKGTDLLLTYDFPFYRFSYWYRITDSEFLKFWIGGGLQIRNANIKFRDRSGAHAFRTSSLGPVPLINLLLDAQFSERFALRTAANGFWAPIKYLNGGKTDVNGWIYEVELQPTVNLKYGWSLFSNLRLLGGGASGNSSESRISGGTFNKDTLVTLGFTFGLLKVI